MADIRFPKAFGCFRLLFAASRFVRFFLLVIFTNYFPNPFFLSSQPLYIIVLLAWTFLKLGQLPVASPPPVFTRHFCAPHIASHCSLILFVSLRRIHAMLSAAVCKKRGCPFPVLCSRQSVSSFWHVPSTLGTFLFPSAPNIPHLSEEGDGRPLPSNNRRRAARIFATS